MSKSSLSSVVSNLVRAQMGTASSGTVTDEDLDRHVADLILKEAKQKAERYGKDGIRAYLQSECSDSNAPKTNKRFLSSIIRSTDDHNKTILRAQALAAQEVRIEREEQERRERRRRAEEAVEAERLRRLMGSGGRTDWAHNWDRGASRDRRRRERSGERRDDYDDKSESSRRRKSSRSEREYRHRHRSKSTERRERREKKRSKHARDRERYDDGDDENWETRSRSRDRSRSRSRSPERARRERDDDEHRQKRRHNSTDEARYRLSSRSPSEKARSRSRRREDLHRHKRRRSSSPTADNGEESSTRERPSSQDLERALSETLAREEQLRLQLKRIGKSKAEDHADAPLSRRSSRSRTPSIPRDAGRKARSPSPVPQSPKAGSSSSHTLRSSASPSRSPPEPPSSPPPLPPHHLPSKMDKYFESSYDPRLDVAPLPVPKVPATGLIDDADFAGWDAMLEVIRQRREYKAEKKMLERWGVGKDKDKKKKKGDDEVASRWSEGGMEIMNIEYKKRGSVREWDLGKEGF
ncbi:uncharacterized protein LAESUDRAFT_752267 [Laetiporus sulphureus 93-53]|uniref:Uncharacterized protein n=1 Tax=Laetiporus sulphureus 93-53 TaxID=1314785 RepID=A0A165C572_9APHY|nr:uncharacterized protein LAESUDRAFT_752267 [Laetiporus sulphureus 93-53]KZT02224.1 hypothetical protein LAESUDRAFT_752267 [Laetiporus sulphureus 93-53]